MRTRVRIGIAATALAAVTALAGAALADELKTARATSAFDAEGVAEARAVCPGKTKSVAGGFQIVSEDPAFAQIREAKRDKRRGFEAAAQDFLPGGAQKLRVFAYCRDELASNSAEIDTLPDGAEADIVATCPQGTTALSGGFTSALAVDAYIMESRRKDARRWLTHWRSFDPAPQATATVVCHEGPAPIARSKTRKLEPGAALEKFRVTAQCPAGTKVLSGGFKSTHPITEPGPYIQTSRRTGPKRWSVGVVLGKFTTRLTAYAYCEET